jgi:hypothetical protein
LEAGHVSGQVCPENDLSERLKQGEHMSTKKPHYPIKGKLPGRRKCFAAVVLIITLITAGSAVAKWSGLLSIGQKKAPSAKEIAPTALTPTAPSKEYVYVGGKLTAIEEQ